MRSREEIFLEVNRDPKFRTMEEVREEARKRYEQEGENISLQNSFIPPSPEEQIQFLAEDLELFQTQKTSLIPYKIIPLQKMLEKPVNIFPYLVDKMIPKRAITTITGDTGSGKSLFVLYLADVISRGEKLFGEYETQKTNVLIFDFEMDEDLLISRCKAVCHQESPVFFIYERIWKIQGENDIKWLREEINLKNIGLIVFDTLSKLHNTEENSNTEMTIVMEEIRKLCTEMNVTVILLHHHNKNPEINGIAKSRGASAIQDNSASYLQIQSKTDVDKEGKAVLNMEISQEKKRRPESIGKIGINIYYNLETQKTRLEYLGVIDETEGAMETAKEAVMKAVEEWPGMSKRRLYEEVNERVLVGKKITNKVLDILINKGDVVWVSVKGIKSGQNKGLFLPKDSPEQNGMVDTLL